MTMQNKVVAQELKPAVDKNVNSSITPTQDMISQAYGGEGSQQYNLGYHYLHGKGVKQSNDEAKKWFDLAAKSNSPAARYKIGRLYETGVFYKKDIDKAVYHYEFAAKKGEVYALNNLAILYLTGEGVAQDIDKGISFAKKAASRGNAEAQVNLGLVYLNGTGVTIDRVQALNWFEEAAKDTHPVALYYLAEHAFAEKDYVRAYNYYLTSAEQSNANAQLKLAMLYGKGIGTEKDHEKSLKWLKEAAKLGNKKAIFMLKRMEK